MAHSSFQSFRSTAHDGEKKGGKPVKAPTAGADRKKKITRCARRVKRKRDNDFESIDPTTNSLVIIKAFVEFQHRVHTLSFLAWFCSSAGTKEILARILYSEWLERLNRRKHICKDILLRKEIDLQHTSSMSSPISTITSKWQVTIPEDVRKELPFKVGQRIVWEVDGDKLVGRRVRSLSELAGSLKSEVSQPPGRKFGSEFAKASVARHQRISRQKP